MAVEADGTKAGCVEAFPPDVHGRVAVTAAGRDLACVVGAGETLVSAFRVGGIVSGVHIHHRLQRMGHDDLRIRFFSTISYPVEKPFPSTMSYSASACSRLSNTSSTRTSS